MKPGQLVMLVKREGDLVEYFPPTGACGEIKPMQDDYVQYMAVGTIPVHFPKHPSKSTTELWAVPKSWLIPLGEPDMDVTEHTHKELETVE